MGEHIFTHSGNFYEPAAGLRAPNGAEAMAADQKLWQSIARLFNREGWSMDNAIHEVSVARADMQQALLMPRPLPPSWMMCGEVAGGVVSRSGSPERSRSRVGVVVLVLKNGERRQLCGDFQFGKCTRAHCKFDHLCAIMPSAGKPCLAAHCAEDHRATPH